MPRVREPKREERESIANANQLIRDAGYEEKADLLDNMLQDNTIAIDHDIKRNLLGHAEKVLLSPFGGLNEQISLISLNPRLFPLVPIIPYGVFHRPLSRRDPALLRLAMVLHHEADHILCDDELAAYGGEITFARKLNADFDSFFPGLSPEGRLSVEAEKRQMKSEAEIYRRLIARRGGRGYGEGYREEPAMDRKDIGKALRVGEIPVRTETRVFPGQPTSAIEVLLDEVGEKILLFEEKEGRLPRDLSELWTEAASLLTPHEQGLVKGRLSNKGTSSSQIPDCWGRPLAYVVPGRIYPSRFDLYSVGECGEDMGGEPPNILYLLDRR
jgi:hypothetical protein